MTVTVNFNGYSAQYTSCTSFTNDGNVVTIVGTNPAGQQGTFQFPWSDVSDKGISITR